MKKIVRICCVLLLAALLPMTARADVIYEPFDSFYEANRDDCTYVGRSYTTNGPNGTVTLYGSPVDEGVEKAYPNATALYVSYTYQTADGILWACCDNWDDDVTGWAPMEYLELIYDGISFSEEYGDQFVTEEGSIGKDYLGQTVFFWAYPGSDYYIDVTLQQDPDGYLPEYSMTYTDENGTQWGKCLYYMGIKGYWINLDNPAADYETLFPDALEERTLAASQPAVTEPVKEIKPAGSNLKLIVTFAVVTVIIVTAALLLIQKKKRV